jgi:signal peptidase II
MSTEATRSVREAVDAASARRMRRASARRWAWFAVAAAAVFAVDQATKAIARAWIEPGETVAVFPGLDLVRGRNEGIAFGLFPGRPGVVIALTVVALVVIALVLVRLARRSALAAVGGGLLIGGSLGNLVDRAIHGGVTDFLDPARWPAFNVADVAIVAGAALVALGLARPRPDGEE